MSLKEEDRKIVVALEMEKAEQIFAETGMLCQAKFWNNLANRLYYSLFHAMTTMLVHDHHEVGTHKGAANRSTCIMSRQVFSQKKKVHSIHKCNLCEKKVTIIAHSM